MGLGAVLHTASGVRLRCARDDGDGRDWLLLPGGPGLGSESLAGLVDCLPGPARVWLVDLPGDGSNRQHAASCRDSWPGVLVEAAHSVPGAIFLGHSTGGMYLLSVPGLEPLLRGLVLISAAPDAGWQAGFAQRVAEQPLPEAEAALARFAAAPGVETLREAMLASAPWNFLPQGLERGRMLLADLPYNPAAMAWSAKHFDADYRARWWPAQLPVLLLSGREDRVVDQSAWAAARWQTANACRVVIDAAGHFPWVEQPQAVAAALAAYAAGLAA